MSLRRVATTVGLLATCVTAASLGAATQARAPTDAPKFVVERQTGGATLAMVARGDRVYLGIGPRLAVMDVSDADAPRLLGVSPLLPDLVQSVVVEGDRAYVGVAPLDREWIFRPQFGDPSSLHVLDIHDPAHIGLLGSWPVPGSGAWVATAAGRVCVVTELDDGIGQAIVLDATDPAAIQVQATLTVGEPFDVTSLGDNVYLVEADEAGASQLRVIDMKRAPATKVVAPVGPTAFRVQQVLLAAQAGYVYAAIEGLDHVTCGYRSWFQVFDVADPTQAQVTATLAIPGCSQNIPGAIAFAITDRRAYFHVGNVYGYDWVAIVDVTDPRAPTNEGTMGTPWERGLHIAPMAAVDGRLYWAGSSFQAYTLAEPVQPQVAGHWQGVYNVSGVVAGAGVAYTADVAGYVAALDTGTADTPTFLGGLAFKPSGSTAAAQSVNYLARDGNRLYLNSNNSRQVVSAGPLRAIDITESASPRTLWTQDVRPRAIAAANGHLFATGMQAYTVGNREFSRVGFDILDPSSGPPMPNRGSLATADTHDSMLIVDETIYLPGHDLQLRILDISDASAPKQIGEWAGRGEATNVDVANGLAFITFGGGLAGRIAAKSELGLSIVDVRNPARTVELSFTPLRGATAVVVADGIAYVAVNDGYVDNSGIIIAFDVRDPAAPRELARIELHESPDHLVYADGQLWVPAGHLGLLALRLVNIPEAPTPAPSPTPIPTDAQLRRLHLPLLLRITVQPAK
jgi:hypothetical protein